MAERLTERQLSALVIYPERVTYGDLVMVVREVRRLRGIIAESEMGSLSVLLAEAQAIMDEWHAQEVRERDSEEADRG